MQQHQYFAGILVLAFISTSQPALASGPCNPPNRVCDDGDGITYKCPPCRPNLRSDADVLSTLRLEEYRESLENYRADLEESRAEHPSESLDSYRKGIGSYRDGIESYREGQTAVRASTTVQRR